jgi:hypothetical protein
MTLLQHTRNVEVIHLHRLHAKIYVADLSHAIITSANLTGGGLNLNYEYGTSIRDSDIVNVVKRDVLAYSGLGARLNAERLSTYCDIADQLREFYRQQQATTSRNVANEFTNAVRRAEDQLVRSSLEGGAMHTVFARTVLYLLGQHGAQTTVQLHRMVEAIHPELCDNTIDRVIDGKRFGKKWKHAVRTAQQQLKQRGLVRYTGTTWVAIPESDKSL